MASVIIFQNGASLSDLDILLSKLRTKQFKQTIILSENAADVGEEGITYLSTYGGTLAEAFQQAREILDQDKVIFINAQAMVRAENFDEQLEQILADDIATFAYAALELGGESIDLPEPSTENIVPNIARCSEWPLMLVAAKRTFIQAVPSEGMTIGTLLGELYIRAISENEILQRTRGRLRISDTEISAARLSDGELAQLLRSAIRGCNIEELFPNHAWNDHKEESAAASYHSLAALFVKLGDTASAVECLRLSDQWEDSPRSLALKGLIALDKGEILGAVANMVSSLQQYELRKKKDGAHYLSFEPGNLDSINSNLEAGLTALNKRDNRGALEHFAEAVFQFDDFHSRHGIDRVQ